MESPEAKEADRLAHNSAYANDFSFRKKARDRAVKAHRADPARGRNAKLKLKYGLTPEAFDSLVKVQGGVCAICSGPPNHGGKEIFCVDHCHTTGKVRGLLCSKCNVAIGMLRDSPQFAASAAYYLAKHEVNNTNKT